MCVAEDRSVIADDYSCNPASYVKARVGQGKDLKSALDDYVRKNPGRKLYFNNAFLYATTATGYDFYQSECNNWSSSGIKRKTDGFNTLFCSEANKIELLWIDSSYRFTYQPVACDMIPSAQKTLYSFDVTAYTKPSDQVKSLDNTARTLEEYRKLKGISGGNSGNKSGEVLLFHKESDHVEFWGIPDNTDYPSSIVIPETVDGLPVTVIADYALSGKSGLKQLTIPKNCTFIADTAFSFITSTCEFIVTAGSYAEQYCKEHDLKYKTK